MSAWSIIACVACIAALLIGPLVIAAMVDAQERDR